jgi:hypothetical protein
MHPVTTRTTCDGLSGYISTKNRSNPPKTTTRSPETGARGVRCPYWVPRVYTEPGTPPPAVLVLGPCWVLLAFSANHWKHSIIMWVLGPCWVSDSQAHPHYRVPTHSPPHTPPPCYGRGGGAGTPAPLQGRGSDHEHASTRQPPCGRQPQPATDQEELR